MEVEDVESALAGANQAVVDWVTDHENWVTGIASRVGVLEEKVAALSGAPAAQTARVNDLRNPAGTHVLVRCPDARIVGVGDLISTAEEYAALPVGSIVTESAEDEPQNLSVKCSALPSAWRALDSGRVPPPPDALMAGVSRRIVRIGYDSEEGKQIEAIPEPPVGSVVLDGDGHAWQRINGVDGDGWASARETTWYPFQWDTLVGWFGCEALTLIHEGDGE